MGVRIAGVQLAGVRLAGVRLAAFRLAAPAILLAILGGCGSNDGGASEAEASTPPRPPNLGEVLHVRGDTVEVRMDEYIFGFATHTLPEGSVILKMQNLGFEYHNIEIHQGDSILFKLDDDVAPGQIRFVGLSLVPGEYEVICTIAGHDGKGMRETLTVVEEGGG